MKMKKLISLIMAITLLFLMICSCSSEVDDSKDEVIVDESAILIDGGMLQYYTPPKDFTTKEKQNHDAYMQSRFPNANRLRSSTRLYNCHSYAWYSTSASNNRWIDDPSPMWGKQGSYKVSLTSTNVNTLQQSTNGTKIVYFKDGEVWHSALIYNSSEVKSKWGPYGLYQHALGYCPYVIEDHCDEIRYYQTSDTVCIY